MFLVSCDIEIKLDEAELDKMVKQTVAFEQETGKKKVELKLDKGILNITGSDQDSLSAVLYRYNQADSAEVNFADGVFSLKAPDREKNLRQWNISIPNGKSTDIKIECNSGDLKLNLQDVDLRKLDIFCAVGSVNLVLGEMINDDVFITLHNSVGYTKVSVPSKTGVQIATTGSMFRLAAPGFFEKGDALVNEKFGNSLSTIYLDIICETGNVEIEQN